MSIHDDLIKIDICLMQARGNIKDYQLLKKHEARTKIWEYQREMNKRYLEGMERFCADNPHPTKPISPRIQINIY